MLRRECPSLRRRADALGRCCRRSTHTRQPTGRAPSGLRGVGALACRRLDRACASVAIQHNKIAFGVFLWLVQLHSHESRP